MNYSIKTDLPLFKSNVVIEGIEQTDNEVNIKGRTIAEEIKVNREEWHTTGNFGFVISDVTTLDLFEKMLELSKCITFARQSKKHIEFLFLVQKKSFYIYWREKPPSF